MSHFPLTDAFVNINAVDLSAHVVGGDFDYDNRTTEDGPCMGQTTAKNLFVLKNWSCRVRFKQDFAAAQVHATLEPLARLGTVTDIKLRPDKSDAISATNPEFQFQAIIQSFRPWGGTFGEVPETEAVLIPAGNSDVVVDTTP